MQKFFRFFRRLVVLAWLLALLFGSSCQAQEWIEAEGLGYASEESMLEDLEYRQMTALQAAKLEAYATLVERLDGVQIDATANVQALRLRSRVVQGKVSGIIKGAEVVSEIYQGNSCRVRVRVPLYGTESVAAAVLPEQTAKAPFAPASPAAVVQGGCTGVIIDCRELGLRRAMSPVIKSENGQKVYGYANLDRDFVIRHGMASYTEEPEGWHERAGNNPLVLRAIALDGHNVNPVLSQQDADRLLAENEKTHFLERCQVVFVE